MHRKLHCTDFLKKWITHHSEFCPYMHNLKLLITYLDKLEFFHLSMLHLMLVIFYNVYIRFTVSTEMCITNTFHSLTSYSVNIYF